MNNSGKKRLLFHHFHFFLLTKANLAAICFLRFSSLFLLTTFPVFTAYKNNCTFEIESTIEDKIDKNTFALAPVVSPANELTLACLWFDSLLRLFIFVIQPAPFCLSFCVSLCLIRL